MTISRDYLLRRRDEELAKAKAAGSSVERVGREALAAAFGEAAERLDRDEWQVAEPGHLTSIKATCARRR